MGEIELLIFLAEGIIWIWGGFVHVTLPLVPIVT